MRVSTEHGSVSGTAGGGLARFRAVPYAAPPFGPNRLLPPVLPTPWEGVRDCTRAGVGAPQPWVRDDPWDRFFNPPRQGPDCLTMDITTPDPGAARLPVMVWIHGGAFITGYGAAPIYPGAAFARAGIVHVAVTYRLGVDGWAHYDEDGDPDNLGLRDQIAALHWVRRNIAAFGGDPYAVTVAGQSAGAMSVAYLLGAPAARGLFRGAISQSGMGATTVSPAQARRVTARATADLGVAPTRADLAATDLDRTRSVVQRLQAESLEPAWSASGLVPGLPFLGVHDTPMLPRPVPEALAAGASAAVAVLAGTTKDEVSGTLRKAGALDRPDPARTVARLAALGVDERIAEVYRAHSRPAASPVELLGAVLADRTFAVPTVALLDAHRGRHHLYRFDWESPSFPAGTGADHTLDIPFVHDALAAFAALGTIGRGYLGDDPPQPLAETMHRAWVDFVTTGDPGWPAYAPGRRATMRFDRRNEVVDDLGGPERRALR